MANLANDSRPMSLNGMVGQHNLLDENKPISILLQSDEPSSMILYGPPGTGKTTLAEIIASIYNLQLIKLNAVSAKKKDFTDAISSAEKTYIESSKEGKPKRTLLLIDEIHSMTKPNQNLLLPYLEIGMIILIGTSTENPYFNLQPALRSRVSNLFEFTQISDEDVLGRLKEVSTKEFDNNVYELIAIRSHGDMRKALNDLEIVQQMSEEDAIQFLSNHSSLNGDSIISMKEDFKSGMQKSIRNSDEKAAIYYASCLIAMGDLDDLIRRCSICAYEDVGLADPEKVSLAIQALDVAERVQLPEAKIPIANAIILLANAKKSNRAYSEINKALSYIEENGFEVNELVQNHKNKEMYHYPFDEEGNWSKTHSSLLPKGVEY